ncbi:MULTISPECIES: agmatine deiminase family protein [Sphingobium]|uniref:agmatine deiminase family protein n=1 Tax=Sphingobium TaxID=165695 RepID=UPI0015EB3A13|nr:MULTISPECIES: agmatine deiminase family protein [Sphingobium]MCW2361370.1 agmatine deiminase [Sphingobium sp. B10D3B]MCW2401951.1 agmatine deiminase [Sphingobium sp. B10D7B]MCW2408930.1 agmatine deiminase [Sphingobium xanthum]
MPHHTPAEWAPQERLWIGFPGNPEEWSVVLQQAQFQAATFASTVAEAGQSVTLIVRAPPDAEAARAAVSPSVEVRYEHFGDIWLRDTGPIAIIGTDKSRTLIDFDFNGWGGKYVMSGDEDIGARLAATTGLPCRHVPIIFEGGAVDTDGTGLFVTTEQCLLNPNRNPTLNRRQIETLLAGALSLSSMLWLGDGLLNDHTDGHVDNLARFVAPGVLAVPEATTPDDPNTAIYEDAAARARAFGLEVVRFPSVGRYDIDGAIFPASYMNFCITNGAVVVPQYGAPNDAEALEALKPFFPDRALVGLPSDAILRGGGSFHCMSQHLPVAAV